MSKPTPAPDEGSYQPTLQDAFGICTMLAQAVDTLNARCAAQDAAIAGLHGELVEIEQNQAVR